MDNSEFEKQKWAHEQAKRDAERAHDDYSEDWLQRNKAAGEAANIALRAAILVNGGAAISLLAFIGGLAAQGRVAHEEIDAVANSLLWFASGVAAALLATLGAYIVNLLQADSVAAKERVWEHPWVKPTTRSRRLLTAAKVFHWVAIMVGVASLVCFILGILDVRKSVGRIGVARAAELSLPAESPVLRDG